eukprot:TRINITY_DN15645_c0_g1_i1.p1 TRINITY_DN15645_c0_g1~~TRINITY_DN15645_c0_g1_i1.p1  ORF type:complete len:240 (-),score=64.17 TRINITY_DN15645_c0_g1_i1:15-734(-)
MPKSKRERLITLAKTGKKGRARKEYLVEQIREALDGFKYIYVFSLENMRNNRLKEVRATWKNSRFFFGKNKVMAIALGKTPEDEIKPELHRVAARISGSCGLMFTNEKPDEVLNFFNTYKQSDFARSGAKATQQVALSKGPMPEFSHAMADRLRKLGLPVMLKNGVIVLEKDFSVCEVGDVLTPEQTKILKLLQIKMSDFHFIPVCSWSEAKGFESLAAAGGKGDKEGDDSDDDENDSD